MTCECDLHKNAECIRPDWTWFGKACRFIWIQMLWKNNSPRAVLVRRHQEKLIDNGPYCMPETLLQFNWSVVSLSSKRS